MGGSLPEILDKLAADFPDIPIATVDSEHDVAAGAPAELVACVRGMCGVVSSAIPIRSSAETSCFGAAIE